MGLSENSLFPVEHALEMMIFFDGFGKITYGNAAAMKKLEYGEDRSEEHTSELQSQR